MVSGKERILCHPYAFGLTDTEQMVFTMDKEGNCVMKDELQETKGLNSNMVRLVFSWRYSMDTTGELMEIL